jgi:hypothetical protein
MSVRTGIVWARSVAGRIAAVLAAVALLASAVGFSAPPAAAGLVSGFSNPERTVLQANVTVQPNDPQDLGKVVLSVPVTLQAGQTRRISDQLTVTVTRGAEVENFVECLDPARGDPDIGVNAAGQPGAHNSGTNYSPSMGQLAMHASLLFTAPYTGTFVCQIRAHTDADDDLGYLLTAVAAAWPGGTWLEVDNFTDAAPQWWQIDTCDSTGSDPHCIFLGRPLGDLGPAHPVTATLFEHDGWIAAPGATMADVVAHMQITSCYHGTASCPEREQGLAGPNLWGGAVLRTHLDFIQLDQRNGYCHVTRTPDTQYTITDDVHHFLVDYNPPPVAISATCGGSRRFLLHVVVSWVAGNPVKIDAGSTFGFRSATNANVIVRRVVPTTTVPGVIGVDEGSVAGHLTGSGLTMGTVTRVVNPARAGTVIAQNSPAWTVEPAGSPVDLTISLGSVTVPDLEGDTSAQATGALTAVGLVAHIEHTAQCLDPGHAIDQRPSAGTSVAPGTTVTFTIDSRPSGIICR